MARPVKTPGDPERAADILDEIEQEERDEKDGIERVEIDFTDDEDDETSDSDEDEDEDEDEEDPEEFKGLDGDESDKQSKLEARIAELEAKLAAASAPGEDDLDGLDEAKLKEMAEKDPVKFLRTLVKLETRGRGDIDSNRVVADLDARNNHRQTVRTNREKITKEFDPSKNPKLAAKARELYRERKKRGIDVDNDPDAEYDAFVRAAHENPELVKVSERRSKPSRNAQPGKGSGKTKGGPIRMSREMFEIGQRWGLDMTNKKVAKEIAALADHYESRRLNK